MGEIGRPNPVMLFVGMLSADDALMTRIGRELSLLYGPLRYESENLVWNYTDYYAEELGNHILRRFLFFQPLIEPDRLAEIKAKTNAIEEAYAKTGDKGPLRRINLDPGYLDTSKLVLASTKDFAHRIYLEQGIYAEVTLLFVRGSFRPVDHTYPDYRSEESLAIFQRMRTDLLKERRNNTLKG